MQADCMQHHSAHCGKSNELSKSNQMSEGIYSLIALRVLKPGYVWSYSIVGKKVVTNTGCKEGLQ